MKGSYLFQKHGGYRNLKNFQVAQLIYDVTTRFGDRYINKQSRTHDRTVPATPSGIQNIADDEVARWGKLEKTPLISPSSQNTQYTPHR